MKNKYFEFLLFSREGKVILGNRWKNALIILIILLATFFSLGLSKGSTQYLKAKMDDPFNTWISFKKNGSISKIELGILMDSLNSNYSKKKFNIRKAKTHLGDYIISPIINFSNNKKSKKQIWHITLNKDDTLFSFIAREMLELRNGNNIDSLIQKFDESYGVIIKKSLLTQMGLKKENALDQNYLKYSVPFDRINLIKKYYVFASVPILGVVDNLPLGVDFICNRHTYNYINFPLYNYIPKYNCDYMVENLDTNMNLQIFISDRIKTDSFITQTKLKLKKTSKDNFWESKYVNGSYFNVESNVSLERLNEIINDKFPFDDVHIVEDFSYVKSHRFCQETDYFGDNYEGEPSYVTIQLDNLKKISELKFYLDNFPEVNNFKESSRGLINIDVSSVKSRKNLLFISELTKVLSIFLLIFSMFSILIFLINIINTHFEKIKQNIGTLKAFGLSNNKLITNYILIYSLIIFLAAVIAFLISIVMGQIGFAVMIFNILDITIEQGEKCFDLLNLSGFLSFLSIIVLSISVVYFRLRKILLSTPGDLIFER